MNFNRHSAFTKVLVVFIREIEFIAPACTGAWPGLAWPGLAWPGLGWSIGGLVVSLVPYTTIRRNSVKSG